MPSTDPVVLEATDIQHFLGYVLDHHAPPSTVVVCSSKSAFLEALQSAPAYEDQQAPQAEAGPPSEQPVTLTSSWARPTLRQLAASQTLKLAFCPDITHLRAYLATYSINQASPSLNGDNTLASTHGINILAVLNSIQLHRQTSAYSAQGLNRTLAVAVEAAHHTASKLILCECAVPFPPSSGEETSSPRPDPNVIPWDQEVSILNVTTKRFGTGERGWVGRSVKVRTIAERWCTFETLSLQLEATGLVPQRQGTEPCRLVETPATPSAPDCIAGA